jgi:hypothetical protein
MSNGEKEPILRATEDEALKAVIDRFLRPVFGFVLSFGKYSREQAFRITALSFVKAMRSKGASPFDSAFIEPLFRQVLAECDSVQPAGIPGLDAFGPLSGPLPSLKIVREALIQLSPSDKALLLLRDQCHLPFERISAITGSPVRDARSACLTARERLRARVTEVLQAGPSHGM